MGRDVRLRGSPREGPPRDHEGPHRTRRGGSVRKPRAKCIVVTTDELTGASVSCNLRKGHYPPHKSKVEHGERLVWWEASAPGDSWNTPEKEEDG